MNFGGTIRINKCGVLIIVALAFLLVLYMYTGKNKRSHQKLAVLPVSHTNIISLKTILAVAVNVAEKGGVEVVKVRERKGGSSELGGHIKGKTKEGAQDRVTEGDLRSHRIMYNGMKNTFPQVKVISEEHTDNIYMDDIIPPASNLENHEISKILLTDETVDAKDVTVWIDPLDATQEYTENLVKYVTTMVCVAVRGRPVIGVIHRPFSKETYWALIGHGNSINLANTGRKNVDQKKFHIVVSRSHTGKAQNYTHQVIEKELDYDIIQVAGAGYKVLEVISGRADVYLHVTVIKKWDLCAGDAILTSIGGTMKTLDDKLLDYSAESNPVNTDGILAYLNPSRLIERLKKIQLSD